MTLPWQEVFLSKLAHDREKGKREHFCFLKLHSLLSKLTFQHCFTLCYSDETISVKIVTSFPLTITKISFQTSLSMTSNHYLTQLVIPLFKKHQVFQDIKFCVLPSCLIIPSLCLCYCLFFIFKIIVF